MRRVLTLLILAAPSTPLAPATKPPSSRDVGRLVNEATTVEEALATARLLPLAGEETQHWETQDVHIARRRKSLTALLRRVTRWTVGGAAAEARRGVLASDDFRRCMHLLAEPGPAEAYAAERRDGLRLVAALAQAPDALAPVAHDLDAAFRVALDELDGAPGATTGLHWAAKRCAAAGAPVATLDALGAAESALELAVPRARERRGPARRRRARGGPAAARGHDRDQKRSARARAAADGVARGARHRGARLQR